MLERLKEHGKAIAVFSGIFLLLLNLFVGIALMDVSGLKSTKQRTRIDNPNKFDAECVIDNTGFTYYQNSVAAGVANFYEKTGIQVYYVYLDLTGEEIKSVEDTRAWVDNYIADYIEHPEYAITIIQTVGAEFDYDKDGYNDYYNLHDVFVYGDETLQLLDAEGIQILQEAFEISNADWDLDAVGDALATAAHYLMDYQSIQMQKAVILAIILVVDIIAVIIAARAIAKHRKHIHDMEILQTPLNDLASKYVDDESQKFRE